MQDIDFDEIDRAVSSTMNDSSDAGSEPQQEVRQAEPQAPRPAPAARRSSGRFMDVMHPSSDMKTPQTQHRSARPAVHASDLHQNETAEKVSEPEQPKPAHHEWPDPLDFHGFKDEAHAEEKVEPVTPDDDEKLVPLDSPFLPGAKVEKRPLGAFSDSDELPLIEEPVKNTAEPELLEAPDEPLLTAETETKEEDDIPNPAAVIIEKAPIEDSHIPASITQQYQEKPSSSDQTSGAIYDTEAYHQPLTHPAKKRSGALVIIWIIALLIFGAGTGAGIYYFVLPML